MSQLTSSVCHLSLQRSHHVTSSSRLSAQNVSPDSGHRDMSSESLSVGEAATTSTQPSQTTTTLTMRSNPLAPLGSQQSVTSDLFRRPSAAHSLGTTAAQTDLVTGLHGNTWSRCSLGRDPNFTGHLLVPPPRSSVDASSVISMSRFSRHVATNETAVGSLGNSVLQENPDIEGASDLKPVAEGVVASGNVGVVVGSNGWNRTSALSLHSQNSFSELRLPGHVMTVDSLPRVNSSN